jgi:hypothetical protein
VPARNGDSGGPIFNDRGEIAGVLFGSDSSSTMGSYCGRLRQFLAPLAGSFARLPPPPNVMIARQIQNPPPNPTAVALAVSPAVASPMNAASNGFSQVRPAAPERAALPNDREERGRPVARARPAGRVAAPVASVAAIDQAVKRPGVGEESVSFAKTASAIAPANLNAAIPVPVAAANADTPFDQLKNFLAVIGLLALFIQTLKILGNAAS